MWFEDLYYNFSCKENKKEIAKFDIVRFCVRPLCELQPLAALDANNIRHHHSCTVMSISLLHFTALFHGEDNSIKRGENHYKSGHM